MLKYQIMIIGIDANEANLKERVGVNQFAFEVIWEIYRQRAGERFLIFLSQPPLADLPPEKPWWQYQVFGPQSFWTWTGLVKRLYFGKPRPNVFFTPSHYGPGFSPIPNMISIMDLGFLRWKEQFTKKDFYQLKYWTCWSVKKAKRIIAISQFTKKDILETYGLKKDKVVVAHPGFTKTKKKKKNEKSGIKGKYILYLGTLKPSKNAEGLIQAFSLLKDKDLKLVIAGKKGWLYQSIFEKTKQLGLEKRVFFPGFVSDSRAETLIKRAQLFAIPSFWEGFGIPALEAMALGCPVLASDQGALPEVIGRAGLIVKPEPKEIAQGMEKILTDLKLRQELVKQGRERAKLFNWQNCSKIILEELKNYENWR